MKTPSISLTSSKASPDCSCSGHTDLRKGRYKPTPFGRSASTLRVKVAPQPGEATGQLFSQVRRSTKDSPSPMQTPSKKTRG